MNRSGIEAVSLSFTTVNIDESGPGPSGWRGDGIDSPSLPELEPVLGARVGMRACSCSPPDPESPERGELPAVWKLWFAESAAESERVKRGGANSSRPSASAARFRLSWSCTSPLCS